MTNATHLQSDYMSVAEVARRLGLSKMTIYRMCDRGDMPSIRIGRSYRIPRIAYDERYGAHVHTAQVPAPAVIPGQTEITE